MIRRFASAVVCGNGPQVSRPGAYSEYPTFNPFLISSFCKTKPRASRAGRFVSRRCANYSASRSERDQYIAAKMIRRNAGTKAMVTCLFWVETAADAPPKQIRYENTTQQQPLFFALPAIIESQFRLLE